MDGDNISVHRELTRANYCTLGIMLCLVSLDVVLDDEKSSRLFDKQRKRHCNLFLKYSSTSGRITQHLFPRHGQ